MSKVLLGHPHASTRAGQKVDSCCLTTASLQGSQALEALLQQAKNGRLPVLLLFLGDGAVVNFKTP